VIGWRDPQLWVNHYSDEPPSPERFVAPQNPDLPIPNKPARGTGLWTSGIDSEYGWLDWCVGEEYFPGDQPLTKASFWKLTPADGLDVIVIDTYDDLARAQARWSWRGLHQLRAAGLVYWGLNFERMAASGIDAIHLTWEGQWATRLSGPASLYGWDMECTLWLRWCFVDVERVDGEPLVQAAVARQRAERAS